jgi:predicted nucleotidyltransferase
MRIESKLPEAVTLLAETLGEALEQVILFGSHANASAHDGSDMDIAVIYSTDIGLGFNEILRITESIEGIVGCKVDLFTCSRQQFENNRRFPLNIEAKVASGQVLLDTGRRAAVDESKLLSVDELRTESAKWMMHNCFRQLRNACAYSGLLEDEVAVSSVIAACWSLKVFLALRDIDTSEKTIRWDFCELAKIAAAHGLSVPSELLLSFGDIHNLKQLDHGLHDILIGPVGLRKAAFHVVSHVLLELPKTVSQVFFDKLAAYSKFADMDGMEDAVETTKEMNKWFGDMKDLEIGR